MNILHKLFGGKILYSLNEENNILGKYDENFLITKDENLVSIISINGISYSSLDDDRIEKIFDIRNNFFKGIDPSIAINIFQKRVPLKIESLKKINTNKHVNKIINQWEDDFEIFNTVYYISLCTKKNFSSALEKQKQKQISTKNINTNFGFLKDKLDENISRLILLLKTFELKQLNSNEVLSFYATYCNMSDTKITAKEGILEDHYISSNVEFKKDYLKHTSSNKKVYSKFVSVKAYDTEKIEANLTREILSLKYNLTICEQIQNISKDKAISKIKDKIRLTKSSYVQDELYELQEKVSSDRETILNYSFSILVSAGTLDQVSNISLEIETILKKYNFVSTVENINLKTLYFSFFPGLEHLNARKRIQTSSAITTLNFFEKDIVGYSKNSFGNVPITTFQTLSGAQYMFNFHNSDKNMALGHTVVIADSESGKTTLISFLMANLLKYNINILGFDKLKGMHNMCHYLNGEYSDLNTEFKLNPFSLFNNENNRNFLMQFFEEMGNIEEKDHEEKIAIIETIERLYEHGEDNISFSDFLTSLPSIDGLQERFLKYKDSLFDNTEDVISFDKQMSILDMETILKDSKTSSLCALYIFHKLKTISEEQGKGFFVFIDEFKDYLSNPKMANRILERLLEARKTNGTMCVAVQNLDFFDFIENKNSFLDSFAHYIIFPTKSQATLVTLEKQLNLTCNELNFLRNTDPSKHQILLKNRKSSESVFLNVSLLKLGKYLDIFDSSSNKVKEVKELMKSHGSHWREKYIK